MVYLIHVIILSLAGYTKLFYIFFFQTVLAWPLPYHVIDKLNAYIIKYIIEMLPFRVDIKISR